MKVHTFEIRKNIEGQDIILYPTLIQHKEKYYLVDCGYEETFPEFVQKLDKLGLEIADLHAILVSHDDIDHIGALHLFKERNPHLMVYSSEIEELSIAGKVKSERLEQAERSLPFLPEEQKSWAEKFINQLESIKRVEVDVTLKDKDIIGEDIEVIATPGHTKGHLSFYISAQKTLVANDALVIEEGKFNIANPMFTLDLAEAVKSVEKIESLNADKIICYHGGVVVGNIAEKLKRLIEQYKSSSSQIDAEMMDI